MDPAQAVEVSMKEAIPAAKLGYSDLAHVSASQLVLKGQSVSGLALDRVTIQESAGICGLSRYCVCHLSSFNIYQGALPIPDQRPSGFECQLFLDLLKEMTHEGDAFAPDLLCFLGMKGAFDLG